MNKVQSILLFLVLEFTLLGLSWAQNCASKFQVIGNHSACLEDSPDLTDSGVSNFVKAVIVSQHNYLRSEVDPPATNMQLMVWDDEVAMVAQRWASSCPSPVSHDESLARSIPGRFASIGQNFASGYENWADTIIAWYSEKHDFTYGQEPAAGKDVGHYTQIVWATSSRLGCGYAKCSGTDVYVCNYAPSGNRRSNKDPVAQYKPYETGVPCELCGACEDNLCDCAEKTCYNGGVLNVTTCQCTCLQDFHVGDTCTLDCSTAEDSSHCESQGGNVFPESSCGQFFNTPDECPFQCKFCQENATSETTTDTKVDTTTDTKVDTTADTKVDTTADTTTTGTTVDVTGTTVTNYPTTCECASVLVTGPTDVEQYLGIYQVHDCLHHGRDVFIHNNGRTYLLYNASQGTWMFTSGLDSAEVYIRVSDTATEPYNVSNTWQMKSADGSTWIDADGLEVGCMCDDSVTGCDVIDIRSAYVNHTFPGFFSYNGTINGRPYYLNKEQGLYLYFHQGDTCSFWGISPSMNSNQWVMHAYDISARVGDISSVWRVGGQAGWREDETLQAVCV